MQLRNLRCIFTSRTCREKVNRSFECKKLLESRSFRVHTVRLIDKDDLHAVQITDEIAAFEESSDTGRINILFSQIKSLIDKGTRSNSEINTARLIRDDEILAHKETYYA